MTRGEWTGDGAADDGWASEAISELRRLGGAQSDYERATINLIASDNAYPAAWTLDPPYAGHIIQEGLVGDRPFAGARLHDDIERLSATIAKRVFGVEHANLQPHSCSQANQAVYHALLRPGDRVCALSFQAGGHLTHGLRSNFSGRLYTFHHLGLGADERIDYASAAEEIRRVAPKLVVCGSSAYPRLLDVGELRAAADAVGARLMLDLSHEAGLIAGGAFANPAPVADVVTMSLDKTLRGPFGGMILCRGELAERIDRAVHPGTQSSFSLRRLADSAHALALTQTPTFRRYAADVISGARRMAACFVAAGFPVVSGGTDKHYFIVDTRAGAGLSGEAAERRLEAVGLLVNRQSVPNDATARMSEASGVRIASAWAVSRGYGSEEFDEIADLLIRGLGEPPEEIAPRVARLTARSRTEDVWRVSSPPAFAVA